MGRIRVTSRIGRTSANRLLAALAAVVLAGPARALEPASPAPAFQTGAARQVEQAELALAETVAQLGVAAGLRRYADPGAVVFAPDPISVGLYARTPRLPGVLWRRAQYIGVAPSGDLAFSLGPSLYKAAGKSSGGFYLTVWKRGPDAQWMVILDRGVDMPAAVFEAAPQPAVLISTVPQARPEQGQGLREADAALDADLSNGPSRAFAPRLDHKPLALRADRPLGLGRRAVLKLIADSPPILEAQLLNAGVSSDGAVGYTYGKARWSSGPGVRTGYYVRVWRNLGQGWRLLVDQTAER